MTVPFSVWLSDFLFHTSEGEYHLQHSLVLQYSSSSIKGTSTALQLRMQVHTGTKCSLSASENICCLGGELLPMVTAVWTHPSCSAWWREFCLLQASGCRIWPRPSPPGTPETHKNQHHIYNGAQTVVGHQWRKPRHWNIELILDHECVSAYLQISAHISQDCQKETTRQSRRAHRSRSLTLFFR